MTVEAGHMNMLAGAAVAGEAGGVILCHGELCCTTCLSYDIYVYPIVVRVLRPPYLFSLAVPFLAYCTFSCLLCIIVLSVPFLSCRIFYLFRYLSLLTIVPVLALAVPFLA